MDREIPGPCTYFKHLHNLIYSLITAAPNTIQANCECGGGGESGGLLPRRPSTELRVTDGLPDLSISCLHSLSLSIGVYPFTQSV